LEGIQETPADVAIGIVGADGTFHLIYTVYMREATLGGNYAGIFDAAGGTLSGMQILSRTVDGSEVMRRCKGNFVKVESPSR
jgi:hypothetical protein